MAAAASQPQRLDGSAHDAVSTSSSTLVNPDIGEKLRRKGSPRLAVGGPGISETYTGYPNGMSSSWNKRGMRQARVTPEVQSSRQRIEYPDDHRCSDQETASGLCACTNEGSSEDSSPSQHVSSSDDDAGIDLDDREAHSASVEDYDKLLIAARRKKLLSEANMQRSLQSSLQEPSSSSSSRIAVHSDPVLPTRKLVRLSRAVKRDGEKDIEEEAGHPSDLDRLWASSPVQPPSHYSLDAPSSTQREGTVEPLASGDATLRPFLGRARGHLQTSSPRKSIDSFYQKLYQEEQQRQDDLRARKEAARERRRQELKRRSSVWPKVDNETLHDRSPQAEEGSSVAESITSGIRPENIEAENTSRQTRSPPPSDNPVVTTDLSDQSPESKMDTSSIRITPRLSPMKPSAEMYRARLAALRASTPTRGEGDDGVVQQLADPRTGQNAESIDDSKGTRAAGQKSLSNTPLRRAFASPAVPGTFFSPSMARPSPPPFSEHLLRAKQKRNSAEAGSNVALSDRLGVTDVADVKQDEDEGEDQVTLGSDYLGHATRQSTPPRNKGLAGKNHVEKQGSLPQAGETTFEGLEIDDPIRETLQQLTAALREVDQLNSMPAVREKLSVALSTSGLVNTQEELKQQEQQLALTQLSQDALYTASMDDAFMGKLDHVRRRLGNLSKVKLAQGERVNVAPVRRWTKKSIITFILQLLLGAVIMMYASELRARHLFLHTYHHPFLPSEMSHYSPLTVQSYLQPLVEAWAGPALLDSFFVGEMATQDILWSIITGPDRAKTTQHLLVKAATLMGFSIRDCFYLSVRIPT